MLNRITNTDDSQTLEIIDIGSSTLCIEELQIKPNSLICDKIENYTKITLILNYSLLSYTWPHIVRKFQTDETVTLNKKLNRMTFVLNHQTNSDHKIQVTSESVTPFFIIMAEGVN